MEQLVVIMHPLKKVIKFYEETMMRTAQHYKKTITDDDLHPLRKYSNYRKAIVLPGAKGNAQYPDMDLLSDRMELREGDKIISDNQPAGYIIREAIYLRYTIDLENVPEEDIRYPDFGKIAENIIQAFSLAPRRRRPFSSREPDMILGGQHSEDCVKKLELELKKRKFNPVIDLYITERYYQCWPDIPITGKK